MPIYVTWLKLQFTQIQDGGRPPFLKIALPPYLSRELSDFDQIWQADAHSNSDDGHLSEINVKTLVYLQLITSKRHIENNKIMNGDIILAALGRCQRASKVISPFIIFAVFDVSFRRCKLQINHSFYIYIWCSIIAVQISTAWIFWSDNLCLSVIMLRRTKFRVNQTINRQT